jgi:hypothetical protein
MYPQTVILYGALLIATVFILIMIRLKAGKLLVLPVVLLYGLSAYEFAMHDWEKTVSAAIRIDLLLEIPVMVGLALWCVIAALIARKRARPL